MDIQSGDIVKILIGDGDKAVYGMHALMVPLKNEFARVQRVSIHQKRGSDNTERVSFTVTPLSSKADISLYYDPAEIESVPYEINKNLPKGRNADIPHNAHNATHYCPSTLNHFLRLHVCGQISYFAEGSWIIYPCPLIAASHIKSSLPIYVHKQDKNTNDSNVQERIKEVQDIIHATQGRSDQLTDQLISLGWPSAPKSVSAHLVIAKQMRDDLVAENKSINKQTENMKKRIDKKQKFFQDNYKQIKAWNVILGDES
jgi:hypothetical protein